MARVSLRRCSKLVRSRVAGAGAAAGCGSVAAALAGLPAALGGCDLVFGGLAVGAAPAGGATRAALGAGVGTVAGAGVGGETGGGGGGGGGGCGACAEGGVTGTAAVPSASATSGLGVSAGLIDAQPAARRTAVNPPATRERRKVCVPMIFIQVIGRGDKIRTCDPLHPMDSLMKPNEMGCNVMDITILLFFQCFRAPTISYCFT